jgi:hypothetical protein
MNSGIVDTDHEIVILCGGQKTLNKDRHIRVYAFPDDGFEFLPKARQAVSEHPMPFSRAELVLETTNINDLMQNNLQIVLLPQDVSHYEVDGGINIPDRYWQEQESPAVAVSCMVKDLGARWINFERGLNPCPQILQGFKTPPRILAAPAVPSA